jgi:hypothetical protein
VHGDAAAEAGAQAPIDQVDPRLPSRVIDGGPKVLDPFRAGSTTSRMRRTFAKPSLFWSRSGRSPTHDMTLPDEAHPIWVKAQAHRAV